MPIERQPAERNSAPRPPRPRRRNLWVAAALAIAVTTSAFVALTQTATAAPAGYSIWPDTAKPAQAAAKETRSVELGVRFRSNVDGSITGLRYYRMAGSTASNRATLWSSNGAVLARTTFSSTTASGWQTVALSTPVAVKANTDYVASYTAPGGQYAADQGILSSSRTVTSRNVTASAGVYNYSLGFPTQSYASSNYYADVLFAPSGSSNPTTTGASTTSPKPTSTSPTTSAPASSTKPGPSNTGVPAGTTLTTYTGPLTITTDGTVIDSKDIKGALIIRAKNVTIRNSKIHDDMSAVAGINVQDSGSATITDSEIYNFQVGIVYNNFTATRLNMHDISFDGIKMGSNATIQNSWLHSPKPSSDAHWDGIQVQAGVINTLIKGNFIDATGADTNSALFLVPDLEQSTNGPLTATGNWLGGGNYTTYILRGRTGNVISNISVTNNRFGHGAKYGPAYVNVPVTWSGNVWDDTGKTVTY